MTKWRTPIALVGVLVAAAALAAWLVGRGGGQGSATTPTRAVARVPPRSALMLAGRTGDLLVGLAVQPGGPIDVTAVRASLAPPQTLRASLDAGPAVAPVASCGHGCFRFRLAALTGKPTRLSVIAGGLGRVSFTLPATVPRRADSLFRHAARTMRRLRFVAYHEFLSSGRVALRSRFELQAPDRLRYVTSSGDRSVLIGTRRWDFSGGRWVETSYQRTREPAYMWEGAGAARLLGRSGSLTVLSAFRPDPDFPAWFRLYVTRDRRIVRADMDAPGHFMVDRFSAFDAQRAIAPPTR